MRVTNVAPTFLSDNINIKMCSVDIINVYISRARAVHLLSSTAYVDVFYDAYFFSFKVLFVHIVQYAECHCEKINSSLRETSISRFPKE